MVKLIQNRPRPQSVTPKAVASTQPPRAPRRKAPAKAPVSGSMDESKRMHEATGGEFYGAQMFTADTSVDLPLSLDQQDLHAAVGANKWALGESHGAFSLSGNRGGLALSQRPQLGVEQLAVSGFSNIGAAGGGASYAAHHSEAQTVRLGLDAFGAERLAGVAPSMNWTNGGGTRAGVGVGLFGATDYSIRLVESYDEPDAPHHGKALVEVRKQFMPGIAFDPSGALQAVGMGLKFCFSRGSETVYRTVMPQREAGKLLHTTRVNKQGLRGLVARIGAATSTTPPPVTMADLNDPLNLLGQSKPLQVGEEITDTARATHTVGVAPGWFGLRVGYFYHRNKSTTASVVRLDETRVKVTIAPKQVDAHSMGIDALLMVDARHESSASQASSHGIVFDLSHPLAWRAYQTLMAEPESLDRTAFANVPGVRLTTEETIASRMHRDGGSVPRPPVRGDLRFAVASQHGVALEQNYTLQRGDKTYQTRRVVHDVQKHRFFKGEAHTRVDTQLHTRTSGGQVEPEFLAVSLTLAFEYAKISDVDAKGLRDALTSISGEAIPEQSEQALGQDYKVAVNRVLGREDFLYMASHAEHDVAAAAERFGADPEALTQVMDGIQNNRSDVHALSHALCDQLARADDAMWMALCSLAPREVATAVDVRSDTFANITNQVRGFLLQNDVAPYDRKNNTQHLKTIAQLQEQVERALVQLESDPLMERYASAAQQQNTGSLLSAKAALAAAATAREAPLSGDATVPVTPRV